MSGGMVDFNVLQFRTYEEYLHSFATTTDMKYLGAIKTITNLAKLGYRTTSRPYEEAEFYTRLEMAILEVRPKITGIQPFSRFMSPNNKDPALIEFKRRELPILSKTLATIVFTMCTDSFGSEISGYLDLGMSWMNAMRNAHGHLNWPGIFEGTEFIEPRPYHLSYSNGRANVLNYTNSDNFTCVHDHRYGLMFMHKGDRKYIPVGGHPNPYQQNVVRTSAISPKYGLVVFYDHVVRKKV